MATQSNRRTPSDYAVLIQYNAQLNAGHWGAESRAAQELHVSHTHVSNALKRLGVKPQLSKKKLATLERDIVASLSKNIGSTEYEPCPGEDIVKASHYEISSQLASKLATIETLCQEKLKDQTLQEIEESEAEPQFFLLQDRPLATPPVQIVVVDTIPVSKGKNRFQREAEEAFLWSMALSLFMSALFVLFIPKSLIFSLCLLVFVLYFWWLTLKAGENWLYWNGRLKQRE